MKPDKWGWRANDQGKKKQSPTPAKQNIMKMEKQI